MSKWIGLIIILLCVVLLTLLTGCASQQPVQMVMQKVAIPTPVACIDKSAIPTRPISQFSELTETAPLFKQTKALLVDRERSNSYTGQLEIIVKRCSELTN